MRPSRSRKTHRVLSVALAAGCAAGLHFSGCLKTSGLDLSADLNKKAEKAAVQAEKDVRDRKLAQSPQKAPLVKKDSLQLASAEEPAKESTSSAVETAWYKKIPNPFSGQKNDKAQPSALNDPFANHPPATAKPKAREKAPEAVAQAAKPKKVQAAPADSAVNKPKISAENWTKKDVAKNSSLESEVPAKKSETSTSATKPAAAKPAAAKSIAQNGATASADAAKARAFPSDRSAVADKTATAKPGSQKPASRVVGPTPPADWTLAAKTSPAVAAAVAAVVKPMPAEAVAPAQSDTAATVTASAAAPSDRQHRKRIKTLLSEAKSHEIRGELHPAYRNTLLAERIAVEHNISFETDEENPRVLAREIASRIYRMNGSDLPQATASSEPAVTTPIATTSVAVATSPAPAAPSTNLDELFPVIESSGVWQTLNPLQTKTHAAAVVVAVENTEAPANPELRLPEIRPLKTAPGAWQPAPEVKTAAIPPAATPPTISQQPAKVEVAITRPETATTRKQPGFAEAPTTTAPEAGVKFAIAQSVSVDENTLPKETVPSFSRLTPAPFPADFESSSKKPAKDASIAMATTAPNFDQMPTLLAPQPHEKAIERSKPADPAFNWEELTSAAPAPPAVWTTLNEHHTPVVKKATKRNWVWGLIGLAAAAVSVGAGLRIARKSGEEEPAQTEEKVEADEHSKPELRIKRAA